MMLNDLWVGLWYKFSALEWFNCQYLIIGTGIDQGVRIALPLFGIPRLQKIIMLSMEKLLLIMTLCTDYTLWNPIRQLWWNHTSRIWLIPNSAISWGYGNKLSSFSIISKTLRYIRNITGVCFCLYWKVEQLMAIYGRVSDSIHFLTKKATAPKTDKHQIMRLKPR